MQTHFISKKSLETIGSGSLQGRLFNAGIIPSEDKEIKLIFEHFTREQLFQNDGPEWIMVPEHVFGCLCESVAHLTEKGYRITVEYCI